MIDRTKYVYCLNRDGWQCVICHKRVNLATAQLAHKIARTKENVKKYGRSVVDHHINLMTTCCQHCSIDVIDSLSIDKEQLLISIKRALENERKEMMGEL